MRKKVISISGIEARVTKLSRASRRVPTVITLEYPETFHEGLVRTCREYGCDPSEIGPVAITSAPCKDDEQWIARCEDPAYQDWWGRVWAETHPEEECHP